MKIIYYAADDTMGDTSDEHCEKYRAWAREQIQTAYPDYDVEVVNQPSLQQVWTDDDEHAEEIQAFVQFLWGDCPWDWMDDAHEETER